MINKYKISCKCGFKAKVVYGREGKSDIEEVFSCPKCKNLFALKFNKKLECKCGNTKLIRYNPNKKKNIDYYKKMVDDKQLTRSKFDELKKFWKEIKDNECPKCGKKDLVWEIIK